MLHKRCVQQQQMTGSLNIQTSYLHTHIINKLMKKEKLSDINYKKNSTYLKSNTKTQELESKAGLLRYYYCLVEKKNKTLGGKDRLLVLFAPYLAYLSQLPYYTPIAGEQLEGEKKRYHLNALTNIKSVSPTELELTFKEKNPTGKEEVDLWSLKFTAEKLAKQWIDLIKRTQDQVLKGSELNLVRPQELFNKEVMGMVAPDHQQQPKPQPRSEFKPAPPAQQKPIVAQSHIQQSQKFNDPTKVSLPGLNEYVRDTVQKDSSQQHIPMGSKIENKAEQARGVPKSQFPIGQKLAPQFAFNMGRSQYPHAPLKHEFDQQIHKQQYSPYEHLKPEMQREMKQSEMNYPEYLKKDMDRELKKSHVASDTMHEQRQRQMLNNEMMYNFARNQIDVRGRTNTNTQQYKKSGLNPAFQNQLYKEYKQPSDYKDVDYKGYPPYKQSLHQEFKTDLARQAELSPQIREQQEREEAARILEFKMQEERLKRADKERNQRLYQEVSLQKQKSKELAASRMKESQKLNDIMKNEYNFWWFKHYDECARDPTSIPKNRELLTIVNKFKTNMQKLCIQIIDEMVLPTDRRKKQSSSNKDMVSEYIIDNIIISVASSSEMRVRSRDGEDVLIDEFDIKVLQSEFRNYNCLSQNIFRTLLDMPDFKGRVPLLALVEYKGFVALAACDSPLNDDLAEPRGLQILADKCNLIRNVFQDDSYVSFKPLKRTIYQKIQEQHESRATGPKRASEKFDIAFIEKVYSLMPQDLNYSKTPQNKFLRPEFVAMQSQPLLGKLVTGIDDVAGRKYSRDLQLACDKLIQVNIPHFVQWLEEFQEPILNSKELSQSLHAQGINIRYLGKAVQHVTTPYFRYVLLADLASRTAKKYFRKSLQQDVHTYWTKAHRDPSLLEVKEYMIQQAFDYVSLLMGNNSESQQMWKILSRQAKYDFGIEVYKHQIPKPIFLLHLIEQLNISFSHQLFEQQSALNKDFVISRNMFEDFLPRSKSYSFEDDLHLLVTLRDLAYIEEPARRNNQLRRLLENNQFPLPSHLADKDEFIGHLILQHSQPTSLWPLTHAPNRQLFKIWLNQLRWTCKDRQSGINYFKQLSTKLTFWYGDHNPFLGKVFQLFSREYMMAHEYQDALVVAKNELVNNLKVFGNSNPNTAQSYVNTGLILIRLSKRQDALSYFMKACQVYESQNKKSSVEWAKISSRAALLLLSFGKLQESLSMTKMCCRIFSQQGKKGIQDLIECYEILGRIFQINGQNSPYLVMGFQAFDNLRTSECNNPMLFERALKVAIYPIFDAVKGKGESTKVLLTLLEWIKDKIFTRGREGEYYQEAFQHIKGLNLIKNVMEQFHSYLQKVTLIIDELFERKVFSSYQGFLGQNRKPSRDEGIGFLQLFESVVMLSGQSFVQGILQQ